MITDQYVREVFKEGENWSRVTGAVLGLTMRGVCPWAEFSDFSKRTHQCRDTLKPKI